MTARMEGLEEAMAWLEDEAVLEANTMAENIVADATENTPVGKTGRLKASWQVKLAKDSKDTAEIENVAPYAAYVEYGTNKMEGAFMLTNATDRELNK